jgi:hypothetical protein
MKRLILAPVVLFAFARCSRSGASGDSAAASAPASTEGAISADSVANQMTPSTPLAAGQAQVELVISKSKDREGSFTDTGPVAACGGTAGQRDFAVSFAASGSTAPQHPLQKLAFHASDLAPGSSTTSFTLDATIQDLNMQKMELKQLPTLALEPGTAGTGKATLTNTNGEMRLVVDGKTDRDEAIALTVRCNKA